MLERLETTRTNARSAMEGRDAQVSKELKTEGSRLEEMLSQIDEVSETVGELHGKINQLQNMVKQAIANAEGGTG